MTITNKLTMELTQNCSSPIIHAVQDDKYSRKLELSLLENGMPWIIPEDAIILIRYLKSDGKGGEYDTLPDENAAWYASENILYLTLAPQVLTTPGIVSLSVTLMREQIQLTTFTIFIKVDAAIHSAYMESEEYFHVPGFLPAPASAKTEQFLQVASVDSAGHVTSLKTATLDSTKIFVEPEEDDIPKVFFGAALPQTKNDTIMSFRYISKTQDISGYCKTKAQGSSSMSYPKKNQTVTLYKDADCTEKLKVNFKSWGEQNKFCFKANWIDLTHARNIATARLWGDVVKSRADYADIPELLRTSPNQGAIDGFPVKVYAGGVYQGRYTINIPKDAWMASMNDSLDTHCILCGESNADDRSLFRATASMDGSDWSDEVHDSVPNAIKIRWNEAIAFIVNSTDEEFVSGIGNYFDVENLIDYYLFGLASCGLDAFGKNQLYMTYDGQKWYATMYDMDSTWGLWWSGAFFVATDYARSEYQDFKDGRGNLLYIRLERLFVENIRARWEELRKDALSINNIINRFERFTDIVPAELVKEDYASTTGGGAFTGIPSKDTNNIQQIRGYAVDRLTYCDTFIRYLGTTESYTTLSYIESDGASYIDTGISGGTNASYELMVQYSDTQPETYDAIFAGGQPPIIPKIIYFNWNGFNFQHSDAAIGTGILFDDKTISGLKYNADGTVSTKWGSENWRTLGTCDSTGNGWGDLTWYVFNSHGEQNATIPVRLYYLKMYTNGILIRDFIPAKRDSDGEIGLWDNVSSTFFENIGSGTFGGNP